jgi:hypothetical protein
VVGEGTTLPPHTTITETQYMGVPVLPLPSVVPLTTHQPPRWNTQRGAPAVRGTIGHAVRYWEKVAFVVVGP